MTVQDWGLLHAKVAQVVGTVFALSNMNLQDKAQADQARAIMQEAQDTWLEYGKALGYTGSDSSIIDKAKRQWFSKRG